MPAEVLESLAELELELSEGESRGIPPGLGPSPETPPRDLRERHPPEPAGYPHTGSPLAFPRHPCLGRSPESPPASADWRVPGLQRTPGGTGWEVGLGALLLPDRGLGFRSVKATVRASRVCLACSLSAGRKPWMQKASPTPGTSHCLVSLSFLIYKTRQKEHSALWVMRPKCIDL